MNSEGYLKMKQLTIGDLIVAITDAALDVTQDEDKAYEIAGLALKRLLEESSPELADFVFAVRGSTMIH